MRDIHVTAHAWAGPRRYQFKLMSMMGLSIRGNVLHSKLTNMGELHQPVNHYGALVNDLICQYFIQWSWLTNLNVGGD